MLVDTSVWVDHFRRGNPRLAKMLLDGEVLCHPFVVGELACSRVAQRREVLSLLVKLPQCETANHEEVLAFVESNRLAGSGIGWIDAHLLASAKLAGTVLWTRDKRLALLARRLGIAPHK